MHGSITLYSTDHCQLCEAALEWLLSMPELAGRPLAVVDVAESADLMTRFAERIPVLEIGHLLLDWPFSREALLSALSGTALTPAPEA